MTADRTTGSFTIHEAKTNLSRIIERVERGEEVVISRAGTPVAKVIPLEPRTRRTARGSLGGRIDLSRDWGLRCDQRGDRPRLRPRDLSRL